MAVEWRYNLDRILVVTTAYVFTENVLNNSVTLKYKDVLY